MKNKLPRKNARIRLLSIISQNLDLTRPLGKNFSEQMQNIAVIVKVSRITLVFLKPPNNSFVFDGNCPLMIV
jgi:hypothetical protein